MSTSDSERVDLRLLSRLMNLPAAPAEPGALLRHLLTAPVPLDLGALTAEEPLAARYVIGPTHKGSCSRALAISSLIRTRWSNSWSWLRTLLQGTPNRRGKSPFPGRLPLFFTTPALRSRSAAAATESPATTMRPCEKDFNGESIRRGLMSRCGRFFAKPWRGSKMETKQKDEPWAMRSVLRLPYFARIF